MKPALQKKLQDSFVEIIRKTSAELPKDVIEAVEGPSESGRCVLEDRPCAGGNQCALHIPWSRARAQLVAELARTPLATLVTEGR